MRRKILNGSGEAAKTSNGLPLDRRQRVRGKRYELAIEKTIVEWPVWTIGNIVWHNRRTGRQRNLTQAFYETLGFRLNHVLKSEFRIIARESNVNSLLPGVSNCGMGSMN